jgi:hypothetical protein
MDKIAFLKCLDWANVRWPNLSLDKKIISSLYEDYKGFSEIALANALALIYQNGAQFLDLPKLYKLTKEQNDLIHLDNKKLPRPIYKNGLKQYLKDNNFKTLKDAIQYEQNNKGNND